MSMFFTAVDVQHLPTNRTAFHWTYPQPLASIKAALGEAIVATNTTLSLVLSCHVVLRGRRPKLTE